MAWAGRNQEISGSHQVLQITELKACTAAALDFRNKLPISAWMSGIKMNQVEGKLLYKPHVQSKVDLWNCRVLISQSLLLCKALPLSLTCLPRPAQGSVLLQHPTHGFLVLCNSHGSCHTKTLLVVPHQGTVTHSGTCSQEGTSYYPSWNSFWNGVLNHIVKNMENPSAEKCFQRVQNLKNFRIIRNSM